MWRRHGVLVVADVAYRQLAFYGTAAPSVRSLAPDIVLRLGTFNKIFVPGVRLGCAVAPGAGDRDDRGQTRTATSAPAPSARPSWPSTSAAATWPRPSSWAAPLYQRRAEAMLAALDRQIPSSVGWTRPSGDFSVWLTAPEHVDTRALVSPAARLGVAYVPCTPFYTDTLGAGALQSRGMVLTCGNLLIMPRGPRWVSS